MFYQYKDSLYENKTVLWCLVFYNGNPHVWKDVFILEQDLGLDVSMDNKPYVK